MILRPTVRMLQAATTGTRDAGVNKGKMAQGQFMRAWLGSIAIIMLAGCASTPVVVSEGATAGLAQRAPAFAVEEPTDPAARAAIPEIIRRLESSGFRQSSRPALLVIVTAAQRERGVGAFAPSKCGTPQWAIDPHGKWLIGGGQAMALQVLIVDAPTGRTLYRSTAYRRTSGGNVTSSAATLAAAALSDFLHPQPSAAAPASRARGERSPGLCA